MTWNGDGVYRFGSGIVLLATGVALVASPANAPLAAALALAAAFRPLADAWHGARGTALRPAVFWATTAAVLGLAAQGLGMREALNSGRPGAGHLTYLAVLSTLAALISVLGARSPGGGAWAILMGLLVLVFLIPWLEGPGLVRDAEGLGHLRLVAPWSLFYGLLVVAGVTNYLPTRYGPAAAWLAAGLALEYLGLTRGDWPRGRRAWIWSAVPWTLAVAARVAGGRSRSRDRARHGLDATWLWFRDRWGVVWALRVLERFNRAAESSRWPSRLSWYGAVPAEPAPGGVEAPEPVVPEAATTTLKGLLRRFATAERLDEASGTRT